MASPYTDMGLIFCGICFGILAMVNLLWLKDYDRFVSHMTLGLVFGLAGKP